MTSRKKLEEVQYIYRASITLPDGRVIYASNYGKKAFRIPVTKQTPANDED